MFIVGELYRLKKGLIHYPANVFNEKKFMSITDDAVLMFLFQCGGGVLDYNKFYFLFKNEILKLYYDQTVEIVYKNYFDHVIIDQ